MENPFSAGKSAENFRVKRGKRVEKEGRCGRVGVVEDEKSEENGSIIRRTSRSLKASVVIQHHPHYRNVMTTATVMPTDACNKSTTNLIIDFFSAFKSTTPIGIYEFF